MPRCGAMFNENVGAVLRAAIGRLEVLRSPLGTAAPTFQSHFQRNL